jgi:hypothetical protein
MMNKKLAPHIVTVAVLAIFVILGLACESSPSSYSGDSSSSGSSSSYTPGNGSNTYTFVNQTDFRKTVNCPPMSVELQPGESFSYSFVSYKDSSDVWVSGGGQVLQSGDYFYIRD